MLSGTRQSIYEYDAISTNSTFGRLIILDDQVYLVVDIDERIKLNPNDQIKVIVGDSYKYVPITYDQALNTLNDTDTPLFAGKSAFVKGAIT